MKQIYIEQIRAFNRYYTQILGLLNKGILDGELGISEVRVMREIYFNSNTTPTQIANTLGLDKGFLSRILKRFERLGLIIRNKSGKDSRSSHVNLSEVGNKSYERINHDSNIQIENMFANFSEQELKAVIQSMNTIYSLFNHTGVDNISDPIVVRPIEEKDNEALATLIRMVFDEFNAPKIGSVYDDPQTNMLYQYFKQANAEYWVVECNYTILGGCGFYPTPGLPSSCAEVVKFYLSDKLRGKGIGSYLLNMIEEKAKKSGYDQLYLESFEIFKDAVFLYEKLGYEHLSGSLGNSGHYATTIHMLKKLLRDDAILC